MYTFIKESQVNTVIPDNSDDGLVSHINVLKEGSVNNIKVSVNITHPYVGDLSVALKGPNGKSVLLHQRKGGNGNNLKKTYSGKMMEDFRGSSTKGKWTLICKDFAPRDAGTLNNWSVEIEANENKKTSTDVFTKQGNVKMFKSAQHCRYVGAVNSLKAFVDIDHADEQALIISLTSPSGKEVVLHDKDGKGRFEATTFKGSTMKGFRGESCNGNWVLCVKDNHGKDKSGVLRMWKLFMEYNPTDDLSNIKGLGNKGESVLNAAGINSYSDLATTSAKKLRAIFDKAKGKFDSIDVDALRAKATEEVENYVP